MHPPLKETIRRYVMHDGSLETDLQNAAPKDLAKQLLSLITMYVNDKNSSTIRELVVCIASGFQPNEEKLGYNGYRQKMDSAETEYCEIKPVNVRTGGDKKKSLNGGGNFTDFTWARLERHEEENPIMLSAGFIDGRLIYIFQYPFTSKKFVKRLKEQLEKKFPDGDVSGLFLRSASFNFHHYADEPRLQTSVFVSKTELKKLSGFITKTVYNHLAKFAK